MISSATNAIKGAAISQTNKMLSIAVDCSALKSIRGMLNVISEITKKRIRIFIYLLVSVCQAIVMKADTIPLGTMISAGMGNPLHAHNMPVITATTGKINEYMYSLCFNSMYPFLYGKFV